MVPNAPLEGTVLVMEELDCEEIKKHIKSVLGSVPSNTALDLHPPYATLTVVLSNCSSTSTEVPEELAAGGKPATAGARETSEQVAPSASQKEPTTVEVAAEPRAFEKVAPKAPNVEHATSEESQILEPGQGAPEQSRATPST
jgi:hypothetical protein